MFIDYEKLKFMHILAMDFFEQTKQMLIIQETFFNHTGELQFRVSFPNEIEQYYTLDLLMVKIADLLREHQEQAQISESIYNARGY